MVAREQRTPQWREHDPLRASDVDPRNPNIQTSTDHGATALTLFSETALDPGAGCHAASAAGLRVLICFQLKQMWLAPSRSHASTTAGLRPRFYHKSAPPV